MRKAKTGTAGKAAVETNGSHRAASQPSGKARAVLDKFELGNVISHLLRRAHFAAEEMFAREFSKDALTPRQKAALVVVYQQPGVNQNDLAGLLHMDRNTVAEMVARLVKRELLRRVPSAGDRRAYELVLAPKGAALLDRVIARDARVERAFIERVPRKDRETLARCLRLLSSGGKR